MLHNDAVCVSTDRELRAHVCSKSATPTSTKLRHRAVLFATSLPLPLQQPPQYQSNGNHNERTNTVNIMSNNVLHSTYILSFLHVAVWHDDGLCVQLLLLQLLQACCSLACRCASSSFCCCKSLATSFFFYLTFSSVTTASESLAT